MKRIELELKNGKVKIATKDPVFLELDDVLEFHVNSPMECFRVVNGIVIPMVNNTFVLKYQELVDGMTVYIREGNQVHTLNPLDVTELKVIGGLIQDRYPDILVKILLDIKELFKTLEDYGKIKEEIKDLNKMYAFLFEELKLKDVIR